MKKVCSAVNLTAAQEKALEDIARGNDISESEILRRILDDWLESINMSLGLTNREKEARKRGGQQRGIMIEGIVLAAKEWNGDLSREELAVHFVYQIFGRVRKTLITPVREQFEPISKRRYVELLNSYGGKYGICRECGKETVKNVDWIIWDREERNVMCEACGYEIYKNHERARKQADRVNRLKRGNKLE